MLKAFVSRVKRRIAIRIVRVRFKTLPLPSAPLGNAWSVAEAHAFRRGNYALTGIHEGAVAIQNGEKVRVLSFFSTQIRALSARWLTVTCTTTPLPFLGRTEPSIWCSLISPHSPPGPQSTWNSP